MKPKKLIESEQSQVEIIEATEDGYHRARFLVTTVDVSNRNGRTYPKELATRETSLSFEGRILGMSKHPVSEPDPLDHFLVFEKAMLEGEHEYFVAKVAPTSKGKDFIELAKAGAMFSVSRRGAGDLKEGTDKYGKKTKIVVPESYTLHGIDVLYPNTQSDPNGHMIQFEAIDSQTESNPMNLTLEQLREENGELVTQIEDAATQPLKEQVTQLEGQVETLTAEKDAALKLAEETQTKLTEIETKVAELTALVEDLTVKAGNAQALLESEKALTEQVVTLTEQVNALTEADNAHKHLLDKVKGERAAWLILDELKTEPTVASVDAKFDEAKRKCDALIEHAVTPAGKTVYTGDENSELNGTPKPVVNAVLEKSKRIAKHVGV